MSPHPVPNTIPHPVPNTIPDPVPDPVPHPVPTCLGVATLAAALLCVAGTPAPREDLSNRIEFQKKFARIKPGLSKAEVLKILGKPDDIRRKKDRVFFTTHTSEILCWGTDKHLGLPTLGQVYINDKGQVQYRFGQRPCKLKAGAFTEKELRRLLNLIDNLPGFSLGAFDARPLLSCVNDLIKLGKKPAFSVVDEYLRVASAWDSKARRQGLFLVLRLMHEVPEKTGHHKVMMIGAPRPAAPKNRKLIPYFPIRLKNDVPFNLVQGYALGGRAQPVERHVEWYRKHGKFKKKPLEPKFEKDDPLLTVKNLFAGLPNNRQIRAWTRDRTNLMWLTMQAMRLHRYEDREAEHRRRVFLGEQKDEKLGSPLRIFADHYAKHVTPGPRPRPKVRPTSKPTPGSGKQKH